MKKEYMNKIALLAMKRFEEIKNSILEDMEDALNEIENAQDDEKKCANVVADFLNAILGADEGAECDGDCECCEACCDKDVEVINFDAIADADDYREVSVMFKEIDPSQGKDTEVAVEFDSDLDMAMLPAVFGKAISEVLYADFGKSGAITKEEIDDIVVQALVDVLFDVTEKAILNAVRSV